MNWEEIVFCKRESQVGSSTLPLFSRTCHCCLPSALWLSVTGQPVPGHQTMVSIRARPDSILWPSQTLVLT